MTLRIGLAGRGTAVPPYLAEFISWCDGRDDLSVAALFIADAQAGGGPGLPARSTGTPGLPRDRQPVRRRLPADPANPVKQGLTALLGRAESRLLGRYPWLGDPRRTVELTGMLAILPLDPVAIAERNIDVLIVFDDVDLSREVLAASGHGAVRFSFQGSQDLASAGFWQVLQRHPATRFSLEAIGPDGQRALLRTGHYPTQATLLLNRANLEKRALHHLQDALCELAAQGAWPTPVSGRPDDGPGVEPGFVDYVAYAGKLGGYVAAKGWDRLLGREECWSVAYLAGDWTEAELHRGIEIESPPGTFLGDPFVIERDGRDYCFVEEYHFNTDKGVIAVYELGEHAARRIGVALDEPFHLSFPYLVQHGGELLMVPESHHADQVRAYRCVEFPLRWELEAILLDGVFAVDSMLFEHEGRWWLLTNLDREDARDPSSELYAYYADSATSTSWTPHPGNPVVLDSRIARNGGLLRLGDRIFRVAQHQGFGRAYGTKLSIREIMRLDPDGFSERHDTWIRPHFARGLRGTHQLSSNGRMTVFDYQRWRRPGRTQLPD